MNLGPGLDKALLPLRKAARYDLDEVDRDDTHFILVVGMEVGPMMRSSRLSEHSDDDPEESGELWHSARFLVPPTWGLGSFYAVMRSPRAI